MGGEQKMLNWVVSSTVLIVGIMILRFFIKGKISLKIQYSLWVIVLLRLLLPISIGETVISVENWLRHLPQNEVYEDYEVSQVKLLEESNQQAYQDVKEPGQGFDAVLKAEDVIVENVEYEIQENRNNEWSLTELVKVIWGFGSIVVGFWFVIANVRFLKKLLGTRKALHIDVEMLASDTEKLLSECRKNLNIYVCDEVETPCLFGLIHPAIYVTSNVVKDEAVLRHVIAHETTHYLHRDHIWGVLRASCLAIHWYNPFVWYAAILSRNDAELACDEATIMRLGETERAAYGHTLIGLTCEKRSAVLLTATTMMGSGKIIKERITLIVKKPKMKMYTLIVVLLIAVLCVGCTFTGAKNDKTNDSIIDATEPEIPTETMEEDGGGLTGVESLTNNRVLFYDALSQDMLITDEEVNNRVLQLLLDEKHLIDTIESQCEMNFEQSIDVDGCPYYRVLEADSWRYYEDIAKDYYSEDYFKEGFTKTYIEEYKLFMEVDGKLYRAAADGVVPAYIEDSIQLWKVDGNTYYATIAAAYASGYFDTIGYQLRPSENKKYGFEIVDKPYVQTKAKDFIHYADLTHDGIDERVHVYITGESGQENTEIRIQVYNEETLDLLYERRLHPRTKFGQWYYINTYNNEDYLMFDEIDMTTEETIYRYEVFYLSENGEKNLYDSDEVYVSPTTITEWKSFAEQTSRYFGGGTLLVKTCGLRLDYSTDIDTEPYYEGLMWLLQEDNLEHVVSDLDSFLEDQERLLDN